MANLNQVQLCPIGRKEAGSAAAPPRRSSDEEHKWTVQFRMRYRLTPQRSTRDSTVQDEVHTDSARCVSRYAKSRKGPKSQRGNGTIWSEARKAWPGERYELKNKINYQKE